MNTPTDDNALNQGFYYFDGDKRLLDARHLFKRLKKSKYLVELDKKDILKSPGEEIDTCYLIEKGSIIAYENYGDARRIFDWYIRGVLLFSEFAAFDRPSPYYYEALEPTTMYSIQISLVRELIKNDLAFARCFNAQITRSMLVAQDLLRKAVTHSVRWRVCDFLLIETEQIGTKSGDGNSATLNRKISQKLLADMLHINRVTALREMHSLEELGLCTMSGGFIEIPDLKLLLAYRDRYI